MLIESRDACLRAAHFCSRTGSHERLYCPENPARATALDATQSLYIVQTTHDCVFKRKRNAGSRTGGHEHLNTLGVCIYRDYNIHIHIQGDPRFDRFGFTPNTWIFRAPPTSGFLDLRKLLPGTFQDFNCDILESKHLLKHVDTLTCKQYIYIYIYI